MTASHLKTGRPAGTSVNLTAAILLERLRVPASARVSECRGLRDDRCTGPRLVGGRDCPEHMKAKRPKRRWKIARSLLRPTLCSPMGSIILRTRAAAQKGRANLRP